VREPLPSPPYLSCQPRHCFISPCFLPRCRCVIPPVTVSLAIVGSRCPLVTREGERSNNEARDISQEIFCRTLLAWCYRLAVFGFVVVVVLIIWLSTLVPPRQSASHDRSHLPGTSSYHIISPFPSPTGMAPPSSSPRCRPLLLIQLLCVASSASRCYSSRSIIARTELIRVSQFPSPSVPT
jgi:hypothetical protein